jgi:hypothetical protein
MLKYNVGTLNSALLPPGDECCVIRRFCAQIFTWTVEFQYLWETAGASLCPTLSARPISVLASCHGIPKLIVQYISMHCKRQQCDTTKQNNCCYVPFTMGRGFRDLFWSNTCDVHWIIEIYSRLQLIFLIEAATFGQSTLLAIRTTVLSCSCRMVV